MPKKIIEVLDVWKTYQMGTTRVNALQGLTLSVEQGEFVSIMGPSGSGKSTAMNMIGCLDTPTTGRIELEGHDISKFHESDLAQIRGRKIGFIFQKFNLLSNLTALENVELPMTFQGITAEQRSKKATKLLESVGLKERINHHPMELSGGEQQRVAIARALANDPDVILADEPTGNLDSKTGDYIMSMLDKLHKQSKRTVILVTHDAHLARHAERICFLKDGRIMGCKRVAR